MSRRMVALIGIIVLTLFTSDCAGIAQADDGPRGNQFVKRAGSELRLHGRAFRFAGTNNYYLMYKSRVMVDDVLEAAAANNLTVVRTWGWLDIGNQDGSNSTTGKSDGVYFQYWDGTKPAYNDGADGLQRLDYVLLKARQEGLRLVIPFTNNWEAFGGMDQYVRWRGAQYHDQFYTDPVIRQWYKDWIAHLLNRTNTLTGIKYKDDPTIMTWELANEPRCKGSGRYPQSSGCTPQTLTTWADEMSTFVKSIDDKHLVSVGDEGFYCVPNAQDWIDNCGEGVDTLALTRLENVDVMSFHLYPDHWGKAKQAGWSTQFIKRHIADARKLNKPVMLGEFGWQDKGTRNVVFKEWTDTVFKEGGSGALYWILSGKQDDDSLYADYDGFTVYAGTPVFRTLGNFAKMMTANRSLTFGPVADDDSATTGFNTSVTLTPGSNDISYGGATLDVKSIDLDPSVTGQQTTRSVTGGTFVSNPTGEVVFTPSENFTGKATVNYTVKDSAARMSNAAALSVIVKPSSTAAQRLFDFEPGTEGWAAANWQSNPGTVTQSATNASTGSHSLRIQSAEGYWFGVDFSTPLDLSTRTVLRYDLTSTTGTNGSVALRVGEKWEWCEIQAASWMNSPHVGDADFGAGGAVTADLTSLSDSCRSKLTEVRSIFFSFNAGSDSYIDNVRVQ